MISYLDGQVVGVMLLGGDLFLVLLQVFLALVVVERELQNLAVFLLKLRFLLNVIHTTQLETVCL